MKWKQIKWKQTAGIALKILAGCGFLTLAGFVSNKQNALPCTQVNVTIDESVQHEFIDRDEILSAVRSSGITGKPMGSINTAMLEKKIMSNPYVEKAEVYSTVDGKLQVNVLQRNPLLRIVNVRDEHFYIDRNGRFMPVSDRYSTPVVVASGFIFDTYSMMQVPEWSSDSVSDSLPSRHHILHQLFDLALYLETDTFWNAQIEQIYVNEGLDIELIPRIGSHRIILGNTDDMREKFQRLYIFYTKGLNNTGWNNYSVINLKYNNQVVCTKIRS
jgi:cell division protein FtsQ